MPFGGGLAPRRPRSHSHMIKAVIFDLGKVLVGFDFQRAYQALQPHCPYPVAEIPQRLAKTDLVERFESGRVEPREFVRQFSETLDLRLDYDRFRELWGSIFLPGTLVPESLIEALHRRYRMVLLSNTNAIHFEMLRRERSILAHFDEFVLSHEAGLLKPDPRIYQEAVRRAGCRPEECFYTDDIAAYVEAGRRAGLQAVQFHSAPRLEEALLAHNVSW